jgi:hypothetical protein
MQRRALIVACILAVIGGIVAAINGIVDPKDEFYSGGPLTAALRSNCLIGDDVIHGRSYPEFKHDLFKRKHPTTIWLSSNVESRRGVNMGFPGLGPQSLLDMVHFLAAATPQRTQLTIYIETSVSWFDPRSRVHTYDESFASKVAYLLSPWTLKSSVDLMRDSRRLAFTGWQEKRVGDSCVVDRGSPSPAWRADGTLAGAAPTRSSVNGRDFAWHRLTALDAALAIARARGWRVVGVSEPAPRWKTYERELSALFAKHGYRWRVRRMPV